MNWADHYIVVFLIVFLNSIVYLIFKKFLFGKQDAGMKFLTINIAKDIAWLVVSLVIIDKTKNNFLFLVICFIISSVLIYASVIRKINKS